MRLLCDANISIRVVAHLRVQGHDVVYVLEHNPNAADEVILIQAVKEGRTVITYDKDFGQLVFEQSVPHCGVILIRTRDELYTSHNLLLDRFFGAHDESEIQEHFWTLTDADTRQA